MARMSSKPEASGQTSDSQAITFAHQEQYRLQETMCHHLKTLADNIKTPSYSLPHHPVSLDIPSNMTKVTLNLTRKDDSLPVLSQTFSVNHAGPQTFSLPKYDDTGASLPPGEYTVKMTGFSNNFDSIDLGYKNITFAPLSPSFYQFSVPKDTQNLSVTLKDATTHAPLGEKTFHNTHYSTAGLRHITLQDMALPQVPSGSFYWHITAQNTKGDTHTLPVTETLNQNNTSPQISSLLSRRLP